MGTVSQSQGKDIKLHTLLDLRSAIPAFIHIRDGKMHEVNALFLGSGSEIGSFIFTFISKQTSRFHLYPKDSFLEPYHL